MCLRERRKRVFSAPDRGSPLLDTRELRYEPVRVAPSIDLFQWPGLGLWRDYNHVDDIAMKNIVLGLLTAIAIGSSLTQAQWLKYPTPGIPRLPDGTANLNAPAPRSASGKPDLSGLWRGTRNLINDISAATQPGELVMLPTAQALLKERIANSQRDDPSAGCVPGGVPRTTFVGSFYPFRTVSTPDRLVILYEAIHTWREIFADGRALPADMNPTWMGYSVGRWDGDEFVVSTAGFNNRGWLDNLGHPATERLRVTERFIRRDFGHMDVRMTVDDPGAYVKPFTVTLPLLFQADQDLLEYVCNENNRYFQILPRNPTPARPLAFGVQPIAVPAGSARVQNRRGLPCWSPSKNSGCLLASRREWRTRCAIRHTRGCSSLEFCAVASARMRRRGSRRPTSRLSWAIGPSI